MIMNKMNHVIINKNRGWRGLAEVVVRTEDYKEMTKMIFSFSQAVWDDLIVAKVMVVQDDEYYYILKLNNDECEERLPKSYQQRSVLIKNAMITINEVNRIKKTEWQSAEAFNWATIMHFIKNRNNHTTSDWNCRGVRVIPEI